ncbi:MAG: DsbA family protein [Granulosicoccus sp.]|nr:DsbA family protein [Granulosicoccus sp.]
MKGTLFYVHDPMCSWCWGFKPALDGLLEQLPASVSVKRVLGGLAQDSDQPMPLAMQQALQQTWLRIQEVIPGTRFNFDFWTQNQPRRSTWPACRAVLAAAGQDAQFEVPMITAIQHAYYLHAQNPSETHVLTDLAAGIGCDTDQFSRYLHSEAAHRELQENRRMAHDLGAHGFPSLFFRNAGMVLSAVIVDYRRPATMLEQIEQANLA